MNTVDNSVVTRQAQPADFSFLSDADKQLMKAIAGMLYAMLGASSNDAIILSGLVVEKAIIGSTARWTLTDGQLLYNHQIYQIKGKTILIPNSILIPNFFIKIETEPVVVAPSPVYDMLMNKTINVHKCYVGSTHLDRVTGTTFDYYDDLIKIPLINENTSRTVGS